MNIFFLGKPTCGKGTQAKLVAEKYGMEMISTGSLFRKMSSKEDLLGIKIKEALSNGEILPSSFPIYLVINSLIQKNKYDSLVFEGSPRKKSEALIWVETFK